MISTWKKNPRIGSQFLWMIFGNPVKRFLKNQQRANNTRIFKRYGVKNWKYFFYPKHIFCWGRAKRLDVNFSEQNYFFNTSYAQKPELWNQNLNTRPNLSHINLSIQVRYAIWVSRGITFDVGIMTTIIQPIVIFYIIEYDVKKQWIYIVYI